MLTKNLTIKEMDEGGKGLARIATLSAVDHDGDTYLPGAFGWKSGGQWCSILPAHDRRATPLGKARVYEEGDQALAELSFNLDIPEAKGWHSAIMFDLAQGESVQEYSYGYNLVEFDYEQRGSDRVRKFKKVEVLEVSPVLKGAGIGTGTLSIKSAELKEKHFAPLIASLGDLAQALPGDPAALSATGLKQIEEIGQAIGGVLAAAGAKGAAEDLAGAIDWLGKAIERHERHMNGAEPPSDASQRKMMDEMKRAYGLLTEGKTPMKADAVAKERAAVETALAGYLLHRSRPHIRG